MRVRTLSWLAILLLASCRPSPPVTTLLEFDPVLVEAESGDCDGQGPCSRATIAFYQLADASVTPVRDLLDLGIRRLAASGGMRGDEAKDERDPLAVARRFVADGDPGPGGTHGWTLETTVRILHAGPHLLGLRADSWRDTGGAHGIETSSLALLDVRDGHRVGLDELLVDGGGEILRRAAEGAFRQARGLGPQSDLTEAGFDFPDGLFLPPERFSVLPEGLVFQFEPYEIGTYVLGSTRFVVPWREILTVTIPDGPLSDLLAAASAEGAE